MGLLRRLGEGIGGIFGRPELGGQLGGLAGQIFGINGNGQRGLPIPGPGQQFPTMLAPQPPQQVPQLPPGFFPPPSQRAQPTNGQLQQELGQLLGGNQLVMEPMQKVINTSPPGWVIVTLPNGSKKAVRKEVARCLGLWKPRKKPPISASDWSKLKRARSVEKKAKRIAETANFRCKKK